MLLHGHIDEVDLVSIVLKSMPIPFKNFVTLLFRVVRELFELAKSYTYSTLWKFDVYKDYKSILSDRHVVNKLTGYYATDVYYSFNNFNLSPC